MSNEKEIDLGEGCKIKISGKDDGSRHFCIDCEGEEEFNFTYKAKGKEVSSFTQKIEEIKKEFNIESDESG